MYLGGIVEDAPTEEVLDRPNHPYTQALLAEAPRIETTRLSFTPMKGNCRARCAASRMPFPSALPACMPRCRVEAPQLKQSRRDTGAPAISTTEGRREQRRLAGGASKSSLASSFIVTCSFARATG